MSDDADNLTQVIRKGNEKMLENMFEHMFSCGMLKDSVCKILKEAAEEVLNRKAHPIEPIDVKVECTDNDNVFKVTLSQPNRIHTDIKYNTTRGQKSSCSVVHSFLHRYYIDVIRNNDRVRSIEPSQWKPTLTSK